VFFVGVRVSPLPVLAKQCQLGIVGLQTGLLMCEEASAREGRRPEAGFEPKQADFFRLFIWK
jgi:hypothetical protein